MRVKNPGFLWFPGGAFVAVGPGDRFAPQLRSRRSARSFAAERLGAPSGYATPTPVDRSTRRSLVAPLPMGRIAPLIATAAIEAA